MADELKESLTKFARGLAAEQWFGSWTYEADVSDKIQAAVAECKADIGRRLLEALGAEKE